MKKIRDFITIGLCVVITLAAIILIIRLFATNHIIPIFIFTAAPLFLFSLNYGPDDMIGINTAKRIAEYSPIIAILGVLIMLWEHNNLETYLDKKLITGTVQAEEGSYENDEGEDVPTTTYNFTPKNTDDNYKIELINLWIVLITFGSPWYLYSGSKKLKTRITQKEMEEYKRKYKYENNENTA